jgi:hypothetical protein
MPTSTHTCIHIPHWIPINPCMQSLSCKCDRSVVEATDSRLRQPNAADYDAPSRQALNVRTHAVQVASVLTASFKACTSDVPRVSFDFSCCPCVRKCCTVAPQVFCLRRWCSETACRQLNEDKKFSRIKESGWFL